mgnify:CR=1 FL=1
MMNLSPGFDLDSLTTAIILIDEHGVVDSEPLPVLRSDVDGRYRWYPKQDSPRRRR